MGLEMVQLVMGLEEEFDLEIPDRDAEPLLTVGLMYDYLLERLDRVGRLRLPSDPIEKPYKWTPEAVWQRLREIIAQQLEIPIERIAAKTHFIDDLDCG